jgi:hypothetical protein
MTTKNPELTIKLQQKRAMLPSQEDYYYATLVKDGKTVNGGFAPISRKDEIIDFLINSAKEKYGDQCKVNIIYD